MFGLSCITSAGKDWISPEALQTSKQIESPVIVLT